MDGWTLNIGTTYKTIQIYPMAVMMCNPP